MLLGGVVESGGDFQIVNNKNLHLRLGLTVEQQWLFYGFSDNFLMILFILIFIFDFCFTFRSFFALFLKSAGCIRFAEIEGNAHVWFNESTIALSIHLIKTQRAPW